MDRLHIWSDPELKDYVDDLAKLESWWYRPTVEKWDALTKSQNGSK